MIKIGITSDHRGYTLKEQIIDKLINKYDITDCGTTSSESVDYPDFAFKLGNLVADKDIDFGIAICGSGIGISIACNKVKKVRCAKVTTKEEAFLARSHNNANVIALSENTNNYKEIIDTFIDTTFSNDEKHRRRVEMIDNYGN